MTGNKIDLDHVANAITAYVFELLKAKAIKYAITSLGIVATGVWGKICIYAIEVFFDKLVMPALEDMKEEGLLFIREKELRHKLKEYVNARNDQEFDRTFDDLIGGSRMR
jgi:hypothetical protein